MSYLVKIPRDGGYDLIWVAESADEAASNPDLFTIDSGTWWKPWTLRAGDTYTNASTGSSIPCDSCEIVSEDPQVTRERELL